MSWFDQFLESLRKSEAKKKLFPVKFKFPNNPTQFELDVTQSHPVQDLQSLIDKKAAKGWRLMNFCWPRNYQGEHLVSIFWYREARNDDTEGQNTQ